MQKIKAIIIDDEVSARNVLGNLLELSFPFIDVVGSAGDLESGVKLIKDENPKLVFLDVEMPNFAGYEIAQFFNEINFHIVFITAYDQYAINAFEINAVDYLLKPVDRSKLAQAIEKVKLKIEENKSILNYNELLSKLKAEENQTIALSESGCKTFVKVKSIIAINAQGAYSKIYLEDRSVLVSKNIGKLEKELSQNKCFLRAHKSWIINIDHIVSYQKGSQTVCLSNDITAKISRNQKIDFEDCL